MSSKLCIVIHSRAQCDSEEINFFEAGEWCSDSEKQLLAKIQDVLTTVRRHSTSIHIDIIIETESLNELSFQLKKKTRDNIVINNQKLSIREVEVLGLIMQGLTNNEIAAKLFISYETVRSHRKNILEKTGAKNTASLINHYHQTFFEK